MRFVQFILGLSIALSVPRIAPAIPDPASDPSGDNPSPQAEILLIVGAPGSERFAAVFGEARQLIEAAAISAPAPVNVIQDDLTDGTPPRQQIFDVLKEMKPDGLLPLWIILTGHGTFDGVDAKFNLRGEDITSKEFKEALQRFTRPVVLVLGFSASAPFLTDLAGPDRIILSATKSGYEMNYSHFARYFAEALLDPDADADRDEQNSLLETFVFAAKQVRDFYESENRLLTENALIDDNGDGRGTPAEWFNGVFTSSEAEDGTEVDGLRAHQLVLIPNEIERQLSLEDRQLRNDLEKELRLLRKNKDQTPPESYRRQLEQIFRQIARIYYPEKSQDPEPVEEQPSDQTPQSETGTDAPGETANDADPQAAESKNVNPDGTAQSSPSDEPDSGRQPQAETETETEAADESSEQPSSDSAKEEDQ